MNGLHFQETYGGMVFSQSPTILGLAIPIYTATAIGSSTISGLPIWNPPGSGVIVELIEVTLSRASGTSDYGSIGLMAGYVNQVVAGSGLTAIAATTPVCGYLGYTGGSKVVSSNAGTVTVTAGVATPPVNGVVGAGWIRTIADQNLDADSATARMTGGRTYNFNGTVIVPPGVLVYIAAMRATSGALYASSIIWKEIQVTR